jgi:hypothetical protein
MNVKCKTQMAQDTGKWQALEKTDEYLGTTGYNKSTFLDKLK